MSWFSGRSAMTSDIWESYWSNQDNWDWWEKPAPEVLDLIRSLSPEGRPRMLDLGCGLGRHAIAFARAGFLVTAVDASTTAVEHLAEWAARLRLPIETHVCEVLTVSLPAEFFDVVLSYNVIYHGSREQFGLAIRQARTLLKHNGIFFFTCPSRQDGKYGFGEMLAPHTFRCTKSVTPGDVHYFADEDDLNELLDGFQVISQWKSEGYWDNKGESQFSSYWQVRAEKT